jgi:hypothetical protein
MEALICKYLGLSIIPFESCPLEISDWLAHDKKDAFALTLYMLGAMVKSDNTSFNALNAYVAADVLMC